VIIGSFYINIYFQNKLLIYGVFVLNSEAKSLRFLFIILKRISHPCEIYYKFVLILFFFSIFTVRIDVLSSVRWYCSKFNPYFQTYQTFHNGLFIIFQIDIPRTVSCASIQSIESMSPPTGQNLSCDQFVILSQVYFVFLFLIIWLKRYVFVSHE